MLAFSTLIEMLRHLSFYFTPLNTKQATLFVKNPEDRPESCAKYD